MSKLPASVDRTRFGAVLTVVILVMAGLSIAYVLGIPFEGDNKPPDYGVAVEETPGDDAVSLGRFETPAPESYPGELEANQNEFAEFRDVTASVGPTYQTTEGTPHFPDAHGPYVVDFNNNGYEDILLIGGEHPVLFENVDGTYQRYQEFEHPEAVNAHFFDFDNDGYRDLLLAKLGEPPVFYENQDGEFVQRDVGFDQSTTYPAAITSADFTGNDCLDVYIGSWAGTGERVMSLSEMTDVGRHHPDVRPTTDTGGPNLLFYGDCETFEEVSSEAGVRGSEFTLAVSAADFTGNGHLDIHVGNDFTGDYLYENLGNGTFAERDLGPASDRNAMSSVAVDVTGNHRLDIFVTNVYFEEYVVESLVPVTQTPLPEGNNLFVNEGDGEFHDRAPEHGIQNGSWGWAATIADYTNDGHLDIIHASSFVNPSVVGDQPDIFEPPQVWKGTSESWEKVHGFDLGLPEHNIRGIARVDYANNGVLDFITVSTPSEPRRAGIRPGEDRAFLYENTHDNDESLQFFVRNPNGLEQHSEVYIETDERTIYKVANARADFFSQDSQLVHVGTANEAIERVVIVWPDGTRTAYNSLTAGNRYILTPEDSKVVH